MKPALEGLAFLLLGLCRVLSVAFIASPCPESNAVLAKREFSYNIPISMFNDEVRDEKRTLVDAVPTHDGVYRACEWR
ncbi:hypothetical protein GCM10007907_24810 [Chitinimonas prasina]|uniref:Uncharacterized protein n=1 Tax=Chitinimonas prasina TaxID=1434937 RepID=A0ABQ5YGH2_9NEIS|nr:hypothetical protein GCM10007907_24810 [Chitinimonas prasina]